MPRGQFSREVQRAEPRRLRLTGPPECAKDGRGPGESPRERIRVPPHLSGPAGDLVSGIEQLADGDVGAVRLEEDPELLVEVGRRVQKAVAQLLELRLPEQEVLADAGVERLDRVDGEVVP